MNDSKYQKRKRFWKIPINDSIDQGGRVNVFGEFVTLFKSGSLEDLLEPNVPELHSPFFKVSRNSIRFRVINYEPIVLCDGVEGLNSSVHVLR